MSSRWLVAVFALLPSLGEGEEVRTGSFADTLARMVSGKVRRIDEKLVAIDSDLAGLPKLDLRRPSRRFGFHSKPLEAEDTQAWIQLDLGRSVEFDHIVVVPADVPEARQSSYLFPRRFKVEVSDDPKFKDSELIVEVSDADCADPGRCPLLYAVNQKKGRYVRFSCLKHHKTESGQFAWALGELMVLSGNYNRAVGVHVTASSRGLKLPPEWRLANVVDGLSILGVPEAGPTSPTHGYHSRRYKDDDTRKVITLDLGQEYSIEEVRLVPSWPREFVDSPGHATPHQMAVWVSPDAEIGEGDVNLYPTREVPKTWYNPFTVQCGGEGASGRYVQVEVLELGGHEGKFHVALSEIQVFSDGENVALGKTVEVSDPQKEKDGPGWGRQFLVDGFSSRHRLLEWPEYIESLVKRRDLEAKRARLEGVRAATARKVADRTIVAGGTFSGVAVFALFALLARQRTLRHRDRLQLREQIARDLHDELGSNLGTISLLSELGSRERNLPGEVRDDFGEIHRTAERSADAMRDIVWLIDLGTASLLDLVAKMREAAEQLIGDVLVLRVTPDEVEELELSLDFRRHVLFAFKEALNNVRRHAQAREVQVAIACSHDSILFEIADDGVGFDVDERRQLGHGLENLIQRASRLDGQCHVESSPGQGSTIRFEVPFKER